MIIEKKIYSKILKFVLAEKKLAETDFLSSDMLHLYMNLEFNKYNYMWRTNL